MKKFTFLFIGTMISFQIMAQWATDPSENTAINLASGEQAIPKVVTSEDGTTYVSWFSNESGNYNVRLQKLDVFGNKLWADDGLLISDNEAMSSLTDWDMAIDQDNYAILTFQDIRNGSNNIYAYRISPDGEFIWSNDGLALSNDAAFSVAPKVCVTNMGDAVFAWQSDDVIIIQKVAPDGTLLWGVSGIVISGNDTFSWPQLIPVGDDDVIMKYFYDVGQFPNITRNLFAQRYDTNGNEVWAEAATVSNAGGITVWTQIIPMENDGNDGFFIAWHDDRDMNNLASIFVQHIDNTGQAVFQDNGVEASLNSGMNHFYANLAFPVGSEDVFVYWNEMDGDQNIRGIYGQKISSTGERLWTDNGKPFIELSSVTVYPMAARAAETDMLVFYEESFDAVSTAVKAMKIDSEGNFVWPDEIVDMSSVQSSKVHPEIGALHNGQWIAVWEDERNADRDIYGQNIQMDGTLGPVEIQGDLEVHPDTLTCDTFGPHYVYVVNNTVENVTVEFPEFTEYYCEITNPSPTEFPYVVAPGDSLTIEAFVIPGSSALGYATDYLEITTDAGDFEVVFLVNWDLLGSVLEQNRNTFRVTTFPNPSPGNVWFDIQSAKNKNLNLIIYNSLGEIIQSLKVDNIGNGKKIVWDRKDENGNEVRPGIYTYRIWDGENEQSGKIVITR